MKTEYRVLIIVILGVLLLVLGAGALKRNSSPLNAPTSTILFLTQPITSFSGIIEKIEGNTITITRKISYRVFIDENTPIEQPASPIPYLFKTVSSPQEKMTIKNIKIGQSAKIDTNEDLRTLAVQEFKATRVTLNAIANTLSGPVFDVNGSTLIIKAYPPSTPSSETPKERNYRVKITDNTEISRNAPDGTPRRFALNDLKRNTWVVAYTDVDINSITEFTALRIDPSISLPLSTDSSATSSSKTR